MGERNRFTVIVSRIGEGMHTDPYFTMDGYSLTIRTDGGLSIEGESGGHSFSAGAWDGLKLDRLIMKVD